MSTIPLDKLVRYSFLDPAGNKKSEVKKVRANSAIVTVGVEQTALQRIFVLEAWRGRCSSPELIQRVLDTNARHHPTQFGCEANAMQSLFAELVAHEAARLKQRLPLVPIYQPTKVDKDWRIRDALQPVVGHGRLFLREDLVELISELTAFPLGEYRDLIDALASAVAMVPRRAPQSQRNADRDALAGYLRKSGVSADRIVARLAEYDRQHTTPLA